MLVRRDVEVFTLSFLDVICCGFGAVILFYVIISAQSGIVEQRATADLRAESNRLDHEVRDGRRYLAELRNTLVRTDQEKVRASGRARELLDRIAKSREELSNYELDTQARRESLERLKADLKALDEENRRLKAAAVTPATGQQVMRVSGDGDREYVTGLKVGGKRVLLLVDASASMLDATLVNVLRMRNMPDDRKLRADKWRQAIAMVDWISAQLPADGQFQVYAFNTGPWPLVEGTDGRWLGTRDGKSLGQALKVLRRTPPAGGTSLENAFAVIRRLSPAPDSVILITDGLPTQAAKPPMFKKLVDTEDREDFMQKAVKSLGPSPPPINTVLLPMEGDPGAPTYFWRLAQSTGGSFMSPSEDWP